AALEYVGVLAIELFEINPQNQEPRTENHPGQAGSWFSVLGSRLVVNEMAPRVHNSGHWTIEGAETSQFEQHLRAMLGLPLGATQTHRHSWMVTCIGTLPDAAAVLAVPGAHLHDYGKAPRAGRKVGHVTVVA